MSTAQDFHLESSEREGRQRRNALLALLVITPPGAVLFAALNLRLGATGLAALAAALLVASVILYVLLRQGRPLQTLVLAYLALLFANILAVLARPDLHPGTTSSLSVLPVLAYLLLDQRVALPVTAVSLLASAAAFVWGAQVAPYRIDEVLIAHIAAPPVALFIVCHFYARSRARSVSEMMDRVFRDSLTGLWNREKLDSEFKRERERAKRTGQPLSMLLIDLDKFKSLNDKHGHDAGDAGLRHFSRMLGGRLRATDVACRIGGEEFAVLLPATDLAGARQIGDELRQALSDGGFRHRGTSIGMTITAGVVQHGPDGDEWDKLFRTADARLYEGKAAGRNRIIADTSRDG